MNIITIMKSSVTLADIARYCQVAQSTVSLALQGSTRVNSATLGRILSAAEELGYNSYANESARRLARHRHGLPSHTGLIAVLFPQDFMELNYFTALFRGISTELIKSGYGVLAVGLPATTGKLRSALPPSLLRGEVDAVIINTLSDELLDILMSQTKMTFPIVKFVNPNVGMSCIKADIRHGMYLAAQHLIQFGHHEILYISHGNFTPDTNERRDGIIQALVEARIDPQNAFHEIPYEKGWLNPATLENNFLTNPEVCGLGDTLLQYIDAHPTITGLLCANDAVAQHTWYALRRAGYRIPNDFSLIGCDDTDPLLDENGENILTTIRLPLREMGKECARLAVQHIIGEVSSDTTLTIPIELIIRNTTRTAQNK